MTSSLMQGVIAAVGVAFVQTVFAAVDCPPSAVVEGPAAMAEPIARLLRLHGVRSERGSCAGRSVRAVVSPNAGSRAYVLHIEDGFGRSNDREVSNPETAASLIESWVLAEDAVLVGPRPLLAVAASDTPAISNRSLATDVGVRVMAAAELTVSDAATWYGGSATMCGRVGALCVGGRARFATTSRPADELLGGDLSRRRLSAVAAVALPVSLGRLSILPTLGVGGEWMRTVASLAQFSTSADDFSLRGEAAAIAAIGFTASWSLLAEVGAAWAPWSSRGSREGAAMFLPVPATTAVHAGIGIGFSR
jgi:hypothetical protein